MDCEASATSIVPAVVAGTRQTSVSRNCPSCVESSASMTDGNLIDGQVTVLARLIVAHQSKNDPV